MPRGRGFGAFAGATHDRSRATWWSMRQGMSAAAIQAKILREILSDYAGEARGLGGIAASLFSKATEFNRTPWDLAASFDFAFLQTRGARPPPELKTGHATSPR